MADAFSSISSINFSGSAKECEELAVLAVFSFGGTFETFDDLATLLQENLQLAMTRKYKKHHLQTVVCKSLVYD